MGHFPLENSILLSVRMEKSWVSSGQQGVLIMNENFDPNTVWYKTIQFLHWAALGCWIYKKRNTKRETVAKIPDKQVARLSSKDHASYFGNMWVPWVWPTVPSGQLHRCIVLEIRMKPEMGPVSSKSRWTTLNIFKKLCNFELDLRFSCLWLQMLLCCVMWCCVVQQICSNPSQHVATV